MLHYNLLFTKLRLHQFGCMNCSLSLSVSERERALARFGGTEPPRICDNVHNAAVVYMSHFGAAMRPCKRCFPVLPLQCKDRPEELLCRQRGRPPNIRLDGEAALAPRPNKASEVFQGYQ